MPPSGGIHKVKVCRHGIMVFNPRDAYVGRSLDLYGEFAEAEVALLCRVVQQGAVVLDVGACIGTHTLPLARAVGESGVVHAFEPQRLFFQCLCGNLALNGITTVRTYQAAVGSRRGEMFALEVDPRHVGNFAGLSLRTAPPGERVPVVTIDGLGLGRVDLIKIDAEGMELEAIRGARHTIEAYRPVLYVENDRPERSGALQRALVRLGYRLFWHTPPLYDPANFFGRTENVFGEVASLNMLCLPAESRWGPHDFVDIRGFHPEPVS